jgi:hypothetical protein
MATDGLGHGPEAAIASQAAITTCYEYPTLAPAQLLKKMHIALKNTRGAAVTIVDIDKMQSTVQFSGIGNINGIIITNQANHHLLSTDGIVGVTPMATHPKEFTYSCSYPALCILHSDGLTTRWALSKYPGLSSRHPAIIAGVLYRDFARGNDDTTLLVLQQNAISINLS